MATCSITFCLKSAIASESFIGLPVLSCCPTQLVLSRAAGVIRYKMLSEHVSLLLKTFQRAPYLRAEAKSLTKTLQGPSTLPLPRRPHLSLLMFLQPHFRVLTIFLSGMLFFHPSYPIDLSTLWVLRGISFESLFKCHFFQGGLPWPPYFELQPPCSPAFLTFLLCCMYFYSPSHLLISYLIYLFVYFMASSSKR